MRLSQKFHVGQIVCAVLNLILAVPLSIEVFGEMRPEVISPLGYVMLFLMFAGTGCALGRLFAEKK